MAIKQQLNKYSIRTAKMALKLTPIETIRFCLQIRKKSLKRSPDVHFPHFL